MYHLAREPLGEGAWILDTFHSTTADDDDDDDDGGGGIMNKLTDNDIIDE